MTERDDEPDPAGRMPGNANAINGEIRRLDDLKERLWSTGEALRHLTITSWAGPAHNAFDDFRHRFARHWLTAGDLHDDAARALERYRWTLVDLQWRIHNASHLSAPDVARWRHQLDTEAHAAAAAIRQAANSLASLPRLLTDPLPTPPAPPAPVERRAAFDPRAADPATFRHRVQRLSDQVLLADIIAISAV